MRELLSDLATENKGEEVKRRIKEEINQYDWTKKSECASSRDHQVVCAFILTPNSVGIVCAGYLQRCQQKTLPNLY